MPLLDIGTAQPSFKYHLVTLSTQTLIHGKVSGKFASGPEKRLASAWKPFQIPKKMDFNVGHLQAQWGKFLIKAVATLELKCSVQGKDGQRGYNKLPLGIDSRPLDNPLQFTSEEYSELDEREKLRRMRISKANKGNTPWNKGKKHSPETLQRIRERTKLAMQDPKVMSCFLPEEWDKFFVKYLYPSFTPTVFLFVAGTVTYGVLKYLQNEGIKNPK